MQFTCHLHLILSTPDLINLSCLFAIGSNMDYCCSFRTFPFLVPKIEITKTKSLYNVIMHLNSINHNKLIKCSLSIIFRGITLFVTFSLLYLKEKNLIPLIMRKYRASITFFYENTFNENCLTNATNIQRCRLLYYYYMYLLSILKGYATYY